MMKIKDIVPQENVNQLLSSLERLTQQHENLAYSALEKGNMLSNLASTATASGFGRAKWIVENWLNEEISEEVQND